MNSSHNSSASKNPTIPPQASQINYPEILRTGTRGALPSAGGGGGREVTNAKSQERQTDGRGKIRGERINIFKAL